MTRISAPLIAIPLVLLLLSCDPNRIEGPAGGSRAIPYNLVLPIDPGDVDYVAVSGTVGRQQSSLVADSIIEVTVWSHYAQFVPQREGLGTPLDVLINTYTLDRHRGGDTLRLRSGDDSDLRTRDQVWSLRDSTTERERGRFILPAVALFEQIGPFPEIVEQRRTIRSDTAFTITWQSGGGGVIAVDWQTDDNRVVRSAQEFEGSFTLPAGTMGMVRGRGTVRISRYRAVTEEVDGMTVAGVRVSQRIFEVTVQ